MNQLKKNRGATVGYLCSKNPSLRPRGTSHARHVISKINDPENWQNLCLKAPLLLVLYPLTFPPPYQAYILNFNPEIGTAKHLVFNTG